MHDLLVPKYGSLPLNNFLLIALGAAVDPSRMVNMTIQYLSLDPIQSDPEQGLDGTSKIQYFLLPLTRVACDDRIRHDGWRNSEKLPTIEVLFYHSYGRYVVRLR